MTRRNLRVDTLGCCDARLICDNNPFGGHPFGGLVSLDEWNPAIETTARANTALRLAIAATQYGREGRNELIRVWLLGCK